MSQNICLKRLALVGASGNVGAATLKHLLHINPEIRITIITRAESSADFPSSAQVTVAKGSYDDPAFLESALRGHEIAMFALSFMAGGLQMRLIDAAAKAGVKWIVPNEYGGDGTKREMFEFLPVLNDKLVARERIEELGMKWIGVATNPWTELSISSGAMGLQVVERTATLYDGSGLFNSCSREQVGRGIAKLLSLPVTSTTNPRASLEHYANNFVYISSFLISQKQVFDSLKRATGTSDADWEIIQSSIEDRMNAGDEKLAAGDFSGVSDKLFSYYMGEGLGGNYESKAKADREVLGLQEEDLDEIVREILKSQQE